MELWERRGNCGKKENCGKNMELWERMEDCGKEWNCGREGIMGKTGIVRETESWERQGVVGKN